MSHDIEQPPAPAKEEKPHFTREQRRIMERIEKEARATHEALVEQFYRFFMANPPESQPVVDKLEEVSAKWKVYCVKRNLNKSAFGLVEKSCTAICEEYLAYRKAESDDAPQGQA